MNKMNNAGRLLVLLLAALMALSLAACGAKGVGKMGSEPKSLEEAVAMHKELMAEETAIFSENTALWEKVFMEADKGMAPHTYPVGLELGLNERRRALVAELRHIL